MICVIISYVVRNEISVGSDKRHTIFDRHDVANMGDFYNGGYGEMYFFLDPTELLISDYIKNVDAYHASFS